MAVEEPRARLTELRTRASRHYPTAHNPRRTPLAHLARTNLSGEHHRPGVARSRRVRLLCDFGAVPGDQHADLGRRNGVGSDHRGAATGRAVRTAASARLWTDRGPSAPTRRTRQRQFEPAPARQFPADILEQLDGRQVRAVRRQRRLRRDRAAAIPAISGYRTSHDTGRGAVCDRGDLRFAAGVSRDRFSRAFAPWRRADQRRRGRR